MNEVAAALPPGAMDHFPAPEGGADGRDAWAIAVADGHAVELAEDAASECLVFAVGAGRLEGPPSRAKLELLLRYNYLTDGNGGLSIALGPDQEVTLLYRHPLAELDASRVLAAVQVLAEQRAAWAELIALAPESTPDALKAQPPAGATFA